jgi:hypothetical protein
MAFRGLFFWPISEICHGRNLRVSVVETDARHDIFGKQFATILPLPTLRG